MSSPYMPSPDEYIRTLGPDQKPPGRWRRWLVRGLVILGLAIVLMGVYIGINLARLSINPFDFSPLKGEADGRINILILGVGDPGHAGQDLSDTNMLVSIKPDTKQLAFISLPRDLRVKIPGYGYNKLNQAHSLGGPELAEQTVSQTLAQPIDYYARTDFRGLQRAVDTVGGVQIDVKQALADPEYPCDNDQYKVCGMKIAAGPQLMNGATALKYARCRKGNCGNDFGRALRQQEVLAALKKKIFTPAILFNPVKLNELATVVGDNVKTDLSINQLVRLAELTRQIPPEQSINVVFSTQPGGLLADGPGSDLVPLGGSYTRLQQAAANVFDQPPPPAPK